MITISKEFVFDAAHKLPGAIYGKCNNLHGHTYKLIVTISGGISNDGWLMNFTELKNLVKKLILDKYDHAYLNDFYDIPTAEIMAKDFFDVLFPHVGKYSCTLYAIRLYETPTSYCEVTG